MEPWLFTQARARPDAPAIDDLTYAQLLSRAQATPPRPAIALPPGLDFGVQLHANLLQGVASVPIDLRLRAEEQRARAAAAPGDALLVMFTSGTSAAPKQVNISRANVEANARGCARALAMTAEDRWLCPLPLAHVGGLLILLRAVICGFAVLLDPPFDADRVARRLNAGEATLVSLVPTMLQRVLDAGLDHPPRLRAVVSGGAPLTPDLRERARQAGVPVLDAYGLTETTSQFVVEGRPFDEARVRLGADGEIHVAGPMVAAAGELATGDLGRWDDGRLVVTGRKADTIVSGGENVAPAEVEAVLLAHPGVREAGVFGRPHPEWGEAVTAHVVGEADPRELAEWCAGRLARFKVPKTIEIVRCLPRTDSGKLLRRSMR